MTVLLYIGLIIVIIANKKPKLKDIILLLSIILLLLDIVYFTFTNIIFNINHIYRYSSIIGDRAFEGDFVSGLILFITSLFLTISYKSWKRNIMLGIIFLGFNYLFTLKSRSSLLATTTGIIILITLTYFLTLKKLKVDNSYKINFLSIAWKNKIKLASLHKKNGILALIILLSITFSILFPFNQQTDRRELGETVASIFDKDFYSNKTRIIFWDASKYMFLENPIFGIGAGNWSGYFPKFRGEFFNDENVDMNSSVYAHNDYLEILAEFGILGLLYPIFIFTGIYKLLRKSLRDVNYLPFFLVAVCFTVTSFFNFTKENLAAMSLFMVALGVGYSSNAKFRIQNSEFFSKYHSHIKTLLLAIGILMLCTGICFKVMSYLNEKTYLEAMQLKAQKKYYEMLNKLDGVSDFFYPVDMNKMPLDFYRGVGYFELKQYDKALEKFRSARRYMKYYPTVMNNEASALYMTGNSKEAEERYKQIKSIFPNYIEPQINLLALYANDSTNMYKAKELLSNIESKEFDGKYVKNYSVFLKIKNYLK